MYQYYCLINENISVHCDTIFNMAITRKKAIDNMDT